MALELEDDPAFHRATWRAQRIGWYVMLAVVLAGFVGLLGRGPLGERTVGDTSFSVHHDRVMRRSAPGSITLRIDRTRLTPPLTWLWATKNVLDGCGPEQIAPTPDQVADDGGRRWFAIRTTAQANSAVVTIACSPEHMGRYVGAIGLAGGSARPVRIVVLP